MQVVSDLHIDHGPYGDFELPAVERDLLVIAGDLAEGCAGRNFVEAELERSDVLYVPGNHEYYNNEMAAVDRFWRDISDGYLSARHRLHYLTEGSVQIAGFTFACATLWSNFWGDPEAARAARSMISDFRLISVDGYARRFSTEDCARRFRDAVVYLSEQTAVDVVVTHHAPSKRSIHPDFTLPENHPELNPYFCNDLDWLVQKLQSRYWVHGHTHRSMEYAIGSTEVRCNPRGYDDAENPDFDPGLVVVA